MKRVTPNTIHRMMSDSQNLCERFNLEPKRRYTPAEFIKVPAAVVTSFYLALELLDHAFLKVDAFDEFVAAVNLIRREIS